MRKMSNLDNDDNDDLHLNANAANRREMMTDRMMMMMMVVEMSVLIRPQPFLRMPAAPPASYPHHLAVGHPRPTSCLFAGP